MNMRNTTHSGILAILLIATCGRIYAATSPPAEKAKPYHIALCPTPFEFSIIGLPETLPIELADSISTCGTFDGHYRYDQSAASLQRLEKLHLMADDIVPGLSLVTTNGGTLDIHVTLHNRTPPCEYVAEQIPVTTRGQFKLSPVSCEDGPKLQLAVTPLSDGPYLSVAAKYIDAAEIARAVERVTELSLENTKLIEGHPISLNFNLVKAHEVLSFLSTRVPEINLYRIGPQAWAFGRESHAKEIARLRNKAYDLDGSEGRAKLKQVLKKIVALSKADTPNRRETDVRQEYDRLAHIHMLEGNYTQAAKALQAQLRQHEIFSIVESVAQVGTLEDLIEVRLYQQDVAGAKRVLKNLLAAVEEVEGPNAPERARVLQHVALSGTVTEHFQFASDLARRAFHILQTADPKRYPRVLGSLVDTENFLANHYLQQDEPANAQAHLERILAMTSVQHGEASPKAYKARVRLARYLVELGEYPQAVQLFETQLALCAELEVTEYPCISSLRRLTRLHVSQGHYAAAIAPWEQLTAMVAAVTGSGGLGRTWIRKRLEILKRLRDLSRAALATTGQSEDTTIAQMAPVDLETTRSVVLKDLPVWSPLISRAKEQIDTLKEAEQRQPEQLALAQYRLAELQFASRRARMLSPAHFNAAWAVLVKSAGPCNTATRMVAERLLAVLAELPPSTLHPSKSRYALPASCQR